MLLFNSFWHTFSGKLLLKSNSAISNSEGKIKEFIMGVQINQVWSALNVQIRAVITTCNTYMHYICLFWVCLIFRWCYRWNCLLLKNFSHRVTFFKSLENRGAGSLKLNDSPENNSQWELIYTTKGFWNECSNGNQFINHSIKWLKERQIYREKVWIQIAISMTN